MSYESKLTTHTTKLLYRQGRSHLNSKLNIQNLSMTNISFCGGAQIRPFNVNDHICITVQPFIQEVLNRFVECQNLA